MANENPIDQSPKRRRHCTVPPISSEGSYPYQPVPNQAIAEVQTNSRPKILSSLEERIRTAITRNHSNESIHSDVESPIPSYQADQIRSDQGVTAGEPL